MSTESEGIFIDTNILIYSTFPDFDSEKHIQSLESLNQLLQSGKPLFVSSQILREYFAISTNGSIFKRPLCLGVDALPYLHSPDAEDPSLTKQSFPGCSRIEAIGDGKPDFS